MAQNDAAQQEEPRPPAEEQPEPPEVAPLLAVLEAQFGERFDDAARERARKQLTALLASAGALAAYPLANADEPDFVFSAFPQE
jgi:hypothetical protein